MNIISNILFGICVLLICIYFTLKIKKKRPLLSPQMFSMYLYIFTLFIMPFVFFNNDKAWFTIGIYNAQSMTKYLIKCLDINFLGFIIFIIFKMYFEFGKKNYLINKVESKKFHISPLVIKCLMAICCVIYLFICYKYVGGLPLFKGRTFYFNSGMISAIYQTVVEVIFINGLFFGLSVVKNKKNVFNWAWFLLSVGLLLSTGTRGTVITSLILPVFLVYIYKRMYNSKHKIKFVFKTLVFAIFLILFGLSISNIRNGESSSLSDSIEQLLYGNTFSDIRDGAKILYGIENKNVGFLFGRTWIAALLSFIPSSFSRFRYTWSFGRFTTEYLFDMVGHAGYRGGWSMEGYLNFGILGIIFTAILQGYFSGICENWFNGKTEKRMKNIENEYLLICLITSFASLFNVSSSFFNFYVNLIYIVFILLISNSLKINANNVYKIRTIKGESL